MGGKAVRHHRIRELLDGPPIGNQEQLQKRLQGVGIRATQATLSRDLRELGVVKGPAGYVMPQNGHAINPHGHGLARSLNTYLTSADRGGNLVVLRTGPGRAQPLALEIDNARLAGVMGTVAGDDTIFVAAKSNDEAAGLLRSLKGLAGIG